MTHEYTAIWNPTANRGNAAKWVGDVEAACRSAGVAIDFVESRSEAHLAETARDAVRAGRIPVAMGGDGSVNMLLNAVHELGSPIAIIPAGTGNALAGELGIPERDPAGAARVLAAGESRQIELAEITHAGGLHMASAVISMGFAADVTERAERINLIKGDLRYVVSVFPTLARQRPYEFELTTDEGTETLKAWMIMVANVRDAGGGMKVTPDAVIDDGLFDLCIVGPVSKGRFLRTFPKVFNGVHVDDPNVEMRQVRQVRISTDRRSICYVDGDRLCELPVEIEVRPAALEVIC